MQVSGPLRAPVLPPCPTQEMEMRVIPKQTEFEGKECCDYWKDSPNVWCNDVIRTDIVNPEKFKYDQFRYQLYAKPNAFDCQEGGISGRAGKGGPNFAGMSGWEALHQPGRRYVPPVTDVRALQQTLYIPVLPSKAGGERDVTFPMTERTMGQPDVTTACCVPVIPCNPGFKNLTDHIKPTAAEICQYGNRCKDGNLQWKDCTGGLACYQGAGGPPPQFISAPSNVRGGGCSGLTDTFPAIQQRQSIPNGTYGGAAAPCDALRGIPAWNSTEGDPARCTRDPRVLCDEDMDDGTGNGVPGVMCMNNSVFRYKDRTARAIKQAQETDEARQRRLHTMFGAYGSAMQPKQNIRSATLGGVKDHITEQGNGFHWDYPKNENRQCYVLSKNQRC